MFGKKAQQRRAIRGFAMIHQMQDDLIHQWSDENADRLAAYTGLQGARYGDKGPAQIIQPLINAMDMHNAAIGAYENGNLDEAKDRCQSVTEWLDQVAPKEHV